MNNLKIFLLLLVTLCVFSCAKEPPQTEDSVLQNAQTIEFVIPEGADDRANVLHYFYLSNPNIIGGYYYQLTVRKQNSSQIVWQSGGWFTGPTSSSRSLNNEETYRAFLTVQPAYSGQTGTIDWELQRSPTCTVSGTRSIPSSGDLANPWNPCQ